MKRKNINIIKNLIIKVYNIIKFGTILAKFYLRPKINMIKIFNIVLMLGIVTVSFSQNQTPFDDKKQDTMETYYMYIKGDSLPRQFIDLEEVYLLNKLKFNSIDAKRDYLKLRRRVRKVYPYAKLAAERLTIMNQRLDSIKSNRKKNIYTRRVQRYTQEEFTEELKKLSRSEGRILIKLIHRQTGTTVFDLVKDLRTGWRAFRYNITAGFFDISLKTEFQPHQVKEDFLIEDVLQRAFQEGALEKQTPAKSFDYFELSKKWSKK